MPIFAHLDNEDLVQVNDRTRMDASKTFITGNEVGGFSYLTVKPGDDEIEIPVYSTTVASRYLDWEFRSFKIDIDSTNNKIDFKEATVLTATLTSGTYTLATLATEIQTQLNAVGANTYVVTVDSDDKLTVSADAVFDLLLDSTNKNVVLTRQLFFEEDELTGKTAYTSNRIELLTRKVTVYAGEDKKQVQTILCLANTAGALNNDYFFIWSALDATKYYVWFNSGATGTDPAISGATGVEVALTSGDTAAQVATALATALDALVPFVASASTATVTVTNAVIGFATAAKEGFGTGFTFAVTTYGQSQVSESSYISVYSELGDRLFCSDSELESEKPEIRKFVKQGRNSFKDVHRTAQLKILEWLDRQGYINVFGEKFTKWDLVDISEVREWARYMALRLIFEGVRNATADIFADERNHYQAEEIVARQRAILRIDVDGDGEIPPWEGADTNSMNLAFR